MFFDRIQSQISDYFADSRESEALGCYYVVIDNIWAHMKYLLTLTVSFKHSKVLKRNHKYSKLIGRVSKYPGDAQKLSRIV